jgi:hypothetical protein|tara:strand:- start:710 stop:1444 length:735 start_codon:yes stop_codon:yes gene_type:complete
MPRTKGSKNKAPAKKPPPKKKRKQTNPKIPADQLEDKAKKLESKLKGLKPSDKIQIKMTVNQYRKYIAWYRDSKGGMGAPTTYKPEYCKQIVDYFAEKCKHPFKSVSMPVLDSNYNITIDEDGGEVYEKKTIPNTPPYLVDFAVEIDVWVDTLSDWAEKHVEFNRAIMHAKEIRTQMIVDNGLLGIYNPHSWIFAAKNLSGMTDRTDITSKDKEVFNVKLQSFEKPTDEELESGNVPALPAPLR